MKELVALIFITAQIGAGTLNNTGANRVLHSKHISVLFYLNVKLTHGWLVVWL